MDKVGGVAVVGLDPDLSRLPRSLVAAAMRRAGAGPAGAAAAYREFGLRILEAVSADAVGVKTQVACYERFGPTGVAVLAELIREARERGMLVIQDAKRGDIGPMMTLYGEAHLGRVEIEGEAWPVFDADALTVNPLLGRDSIEPLLSICERYGKGIFCLVRTSNPGAADVQARLLADGRSVSELLASFVTDCAEAGRERGDRAGYSAVGAVVAANLTSREEAEYLRQVLRRSIVLAPGYGAQGGTAEAAAPLFDAAGGGLLVAASRSLLYAYQDPEYRELGEERYAAACGAALAGMNRELARVRPGGVPGAFRPRG